MGSMAHYSGELSSAPKEKEDPLIQSWDWSSAKKVP